MFNKKEFLKLLCGGDLLGLEYMEENLIQPMKDRVRSTPQSDWLWEEYIINLFYATYNLLTCETIEEQSLCRKPDFETHFEPDLYIDVKLKLLEELGIAREELEEAEMEI